jgi:hypothetical protein
MLVKIAKITTSAATMNRVGKIALRRLPIRTVLNFVLPYRSCSSVLLLARRPAPAEIVLVRPTKPVA